MRAFVKVNLTCAVLLTSVVPSAAQLADSPYGTAKFEPYKDIDQIKPLKVVWDFNFSIRARSALCSTTSTRC